MASLAAGVKRSFVTMATEAADQSPRATRGHQRQTSTRAQLDEPEDQSTLATPAPSPPLTTHAPIYSAHTFESDASIVLTGIRGSGKSTLAIIASTAMNRKVVDSEKTFQEATGLSSSGYKKEYGGIECSRRKTAILRDIMSKHKKDALIVCSWMDRQVQTILRDTATAHPVIHIVRDSKAIQEHLKVWDEAKVRDLQDASGAVFRRCTQLEFFNVSETPSRQSATAEDSEIPAPVDTRSPAPYLTLKRAERHFLKFLSLIFPQGTIPFIESAFPLACIPTEKRTFTCAVSLPLSSLLSRDPDTAGIETGADAIELVVDHPIRSDISQTPDCSQLSPHHAFEISHAMGQVRRNIVIPIFYHVPFPEAALANEALKALYVSCVCHGMRLGPEYISVDLRLEENVLYYLKHMKGRSKLVGDLQETRNDAPSWSNPGWLSYYRKAQRIGCDLVRFTRPATEIKDNFEIKHIQVAVDSAGGPKLPLIAYNTGSLGRLSACFNQVLTSVAPQYNGHDEAQAPAEQAISSLQPEITATQMTQALYNSFVYDAMKLYVFGASVRQSLSPAMHGAALKALGIPHIYKPFMAETVEDLREAVNDPYFAGASLGLPFKVEALSLTQSLSHHARAIGAANTLIPLRGTAAPGDPAFFSTMNRPGPIRGFYGENTDWIGMRACIRRGLSPANAVRCSSTGLVIGAGGMARAAVYSMLQLGVKNIAVLNRTVSNAEKMVSHFQKLLSEKAIPLSSAASDDNTRFHVIHSRDDPWPAGSFRHPTIIVSCIPTEQIGETPAPNFSLNPEWLSSPTGGVVIELAYESLKTPLLEQARQDAHRGWVAMDGLDVLPEQGFAQFELFTGRRAPRTLMKREVFKAYPEGEGRSNRVHLRPRLNKVGEEEP